MLRRLGGLVGNQTEGDSASPGHRLRCLPVAVAILKLLSNQFQQTITKALPMITILVCSSSSSTTGKAIGTALQSPTSAYPSPFD